MNSATSQERKKVGSESTHLRSRQSVRPSDPGYDAHVLAHIMTKIVVDPVRGCWLWQGFIQPIRLSPKGLTIGGYSSIGYRGRNFAVHRVVWMIHHGRQQPKKMDVCHECDVRHCCNPGHLWLGTRKQNLLDMADKKRGNKASKTHCIRNHPLSGDNVQWSNGGRRRNCKECDRLIHRTPKYLAWHRQYQKRRRADKRAAREALS